MTDITATTEAEVIDAVRGARDWKSPLNIVGARTKRNLGRAVASWGTVLDLSGLRGIIAYEPDELTLTVKPGTPVAEINTLLAEKNQRLGFEPADWGPLLDASANQGTIGGAIAADVSGSAAVRYGRARDSLLGIRAVNGLGEAYKAGGKVVKNVTGFDLPKLMCGAMGTLGPLTELTLRVFPKPEFSAVLTVQDVAPEDGLAILRRVWSSPLEATGLAYDGAALIRLEGAREPLRQKIDALREMLGSANVLETDETIFDAIGGKAFADGDIWRVVLPPARAAEFVAAIGAKNWIADWAGGLLWVATDASLHVPAARCGGSAILMRARAETREKHPVFPPLSAELSALTRSVKAAFDPAGLFNPGRMYEGI